MRIILLLPGFLFISCFSNSEKNSFKSGSPKTDSLQIKLDINNYPVVKANIRKRVVDGSPSSQNTDFSKLFTVIVTDSIIPYWYGTKWNFYGNTQTPQTGTIACGYFVTTVLRDAGCPINRVKLAQYAAEKIVTELVNKKLIKRYSNVTLDKFIADIKQQGQGLFIIGLDNHVGFILNDDLGVWFIHSSFVSPGCVAKQDASVNGILNASKYRITGKISADEMFLARWVKNLKSK
jgi:hypothetical protein